MADPSSAGRRAAERLVEAGGDPRTVDLIADLFSTAIGRFEASGGGTARHLFWVPGRLEVLGKHTDYAGGRTLVAAVPRGFAVVAGARGDGQIQVADAARDQSVTFGPAGERAEPGPHGVGGWRHYVGTVIGRLRHNFPGAMDGATIAFASNLPRASGMSSSSALMVGIAASLIRIGQLDARPEWLGAIRSRLDAASYFACIENGLDYGALAGDAGVGTHGGSEDHAAMVTGRPGHLSAFAFVPPRLLEEVRMPEDWVFVLTPSGIAADKTGGALGPYNRLARGIQILLDRWNQHGSPASSLAHALAMSPQAADTLRVLARESRDPEWPAEALEARLDHFLREDVRVGDAVGAFRAADAATVGLLARESQRDAEVLLGNQVPATVALPAAALRLGAFAASSFGAGFGGSVWALVPRDRAEAFARAWHAGAFVAPPAPPLTEL